MAQYLLMAERVRVRQQMLPSSQCIVNCPKHRWSLSDRFSGGCGAASIDFKSLRFAPRTTIPRLPPLPKVRPHAQVSGPRKWCWRRRYDIDKLVAHLAINRKRARMSVTKALNLNDIFHFAADALPSQLLGFRRPV